MFHPRMECVLFQENVDKATKKQDFKQLSKMLDNESL